MGIDDIDSKVLAILQQQGRKSWAELGGEVGLSAPAVAERVRKLEDAGILRGFRAELDARVLGWGVTAFVAVTLADIRTRDQFVARIRESSEVLECHHVAGEDDYWLKVRCRDLAELDRFLSTTLKGELGVARSRTTIVLATAKETALVDLRQPAM